MTKKEKERLELEFSRKQYNQTMLPKELNEQVREVEERLNKGLDIWDNEELYEKYQKIKNLNLSDKRLLIVFSIFNGSIAKTASFFSVNRRTVQTAIDRIKKEELKLDINEK